ncbi:MAG TPA: hypothetical protein VFZ01_13525 [Geminicoccaceae bacterium]
MTEYDAALAAASRSVVRAGSPSADAHEQSGGTRAELAQLEPLISAALLTATAFRLRDREALDEALRLLVGATHEIEKKVLSVAA